MAVEKKTENETKENKKIPLDQLNLTTEWIKHHDPQAVLDTIQEQSTFRVECELKGWELGHSFGGGYQGAVFFASRTGHKGEFVIKVTPMDAWDRDAHLMSSLPVSIMMGEKGIGPVVRDAFVCTERQAVRRWTKEVTTDSEVLRTTKAVFVLAMDEISGFSLDMALAGLKQEDARQLASDLCAKIKIMHALHILHNDLKPQNILVTEEDTGKEVWDLVPWIIDFGFASMHQNKIPMGVQMDQMNWIMDCFADKVKNVDWKTFFAKCLQEEDQPSPETKSTPWTLDTLPEKVSWSELVSRNGTQTEEKKEKGETEPILPWENAFIHLGSGTQQHVFDARTFVIKFEHERFSTASMHMELPGVIVQRYINQPKLYARTQDLDIEMPDGQVQGAWAQEKLKPIETGTIDGIVATYVQKVTQAKPSDWPLAWQFGYSGYEYGLNEKGEPRVFDFG
jgi:tRNA A-37 threonylcarbamoyl transferase component Bud32